MRRIAVVVALVAVAAGFGIAPLRAAAQPEARPSLEVVSLDPLRIRGERFRAAERVRVTAWINGRKSVVRTRAGRRGVFVVAYPVSTSRGACNASVTALAVGDRGSRAGVSLAHIACPPTR